ncbi:hypothetical protein GH714_032363 [Hevea brasiliensis]|uniref:Uncharacterized protein n=1 Tax=Hevea brasiliensis TaxID=3981 RepID=A0A6A6LG62_HEVBR|nr:hypothetical protein GH714_032363 [Hevea brasiliensis]
MGLIMDTWTEVSGRTMGPEWSACEAAEVGAVSLRASTRVSSGFALVRHSSPSFGSRQAYSHSNPSQKIEVGGGTTLEGISPVSFLAPYRFTRPLARTHLRLFGPCYKMGRIGSPLADARRAQVSGHAVTARAAIHDRCDGISAGISSARA